MGLFSKKKETPAVDVSSLAVMTLADVASHKSRNDCWIVISGIVYNVTSWMDDHPGGDDILLENGGKDATDAFDEIGHSKDAKKQLVKYAIGRL
jgi:cytochrome b involved in lipid metabolism